MRLSKLDKQVIVNTIVADIPRKFTAAETEAKLQKVVDECAMATLPPEIAVVFADKNLRQFLEFGTSNPGYFLKNDDNYGWMRELGGIRYLAQFNENFGLTTADGYAKFKLILDEYIQESNQIEAVKEKLKLSIDGITTTQSLIKQFPEFEKYVPSESVKVKTLPAIANVMASLSSMGWPKTA